MVIHGDLILFTIFSLFSYSQYARPGKNEPMAGSGRAGRRESTKYKQWWYWNVLRIEAKKRRNYGRKENEKGTRQASSEEWKKTTTTKIKKAKKVKPFSHFKVAVVPARCYRRCCRCSTLIVFRECIWPSVLAAVRACVLYVLNYFLCHSCVRDVEQYNGPYRLTQRWISYDGGNDGSSNDNETSDRKEIKQI